MVPRLGVLLATLLFSVSASAGVWVQTGNMISGSVNWADSSTVGYAFPQGFLLGFNLLNLHNTVSGSQSVNAYGFKGGFLMKGFELTGSYLPSAHDHTNGTSQSGSGFAVNVGYTWFFNKNFGLGVYGVYWANTYDLPAGALGPANTFHETTPLLSATLRF